MSDTGTSAVYRTPPELWKDIFDIALEWFRHPGGGKDDLANLIGPWNECDQFHRYMKSLLIRKNLRLVCRAWATLAPIMNGHMVFIDRNRRCWPSVGCLETATCINIKAFETICVRKIE